MKASTFSSSDLFPVVLPLGLFGMTSRPATDPDLWWHLRTGQWIVETGQVPHSDPFSFTRAGHAWVSHEWFSEVVFYELWKHGGAAALIVFSAIVTTVGFMLLYLRCPGKRHWAVAATALGALAAAPSWGVRPQMFTFTLASLLLWLLAAGEERPRLLYWIPPLFLLWLNLHAGFALGPGLMIAYGGGMLIETAVGSTPWSQARPAIFRISLVLLTCLILVRLNPSGALLYRYPFDTLRSPGMRSVIGEWFSPDFHQWLYRPFLLVWLLTLIAVAVSRSKPKGRVLVPLLLTSFAALDAVRHIPIFILVAVPVLAAAVPASSDLFGAKPHRRGVGLRPYFFGTVVLLLALLAGVKWANLVRNQPISEAKQYPQRAVEYLHTAGGPRNIFVYYDWGGYAIWKLYPDSRVFVDGRADLYVAGKEGSGADDDILRQFETAVLLRTGWREVLDRWKVEAVLVPPSTALAQGLFLDPGWRTAFRDADSVLLLRISSSEGSGPSRPAIVAAARPSLGQ